MIVIVDSGKQSFTGSTRNKMVGLTQCAGMRTAHSFSASSLWGELSILILVTVFVAVPLCS